MPHRPPLAWTAPVAALLAALVVAVPTAALSGAVTPLALGDAGPVVRWGMVLLRVVHHVAASLTIGLLLMAAFLVREGRTTSRRATAARVASLSALLWALSALGILVLGFGDLAGIDPSTPGYLSQLWGNMSLELMTLRGLEVAMVAVLVPFAALARTRGALAWATVLALLALLPLAFSGHASGTDGHETAVTSLGIHLVGITVWVGGLLALALLLPVLGPALGDALRRYSTLAVWCFAGVGLSGVLFSLLTVEEPADLLTPYWTVIWLKVAALAGLFVFGLLQRRSIVAGDEDRPRAFAQLATLEVVLMGAAIALGTVLGRTPPPAGGEPRVGDMAYVLTGYPMPEPFTWGRLFTTWQVNWLFLLTALVAIGLYLAGVATLRRRGDHWPVLRVVLWVAGWLLFIWVTSGGPSAYGRVMFSQHMIMHMILMMGVPILLVPGQAITLAYRALPARRDRTLGPREVITAVVHSPWAKFIVNPVVAAVIFFGSLIAFYWTGMLQWSMTTHVGHTFMVVHFTLSGFTFVWSLVGQDPGPPKWAAPMRIIVLLGTLAAHAFFGLALMSGTWLLAPEFYKTIDVPWVDSLIADQQLGGAIAWGVGELPTVIIVLMVMVDWIRSDGRESRRVDRRADRDGDAELAAYNAHLQQLHERSQR